MEYEHRRIFADSLYQKILSLTYCYKAYTKKATTFQGPLEDHTRFSRTIYKESNFTDCPKMYIPSPF